MEQKCPGCMWIKEEIDRRNDLLNLFERIQDAGFARITQEGTAVLVRDRDRHVHCDHATGQLAEKGSG